MGGGRTARGGAHGPSEPAFARAPARCPRPPPSAGRHCDAQGPRPPLRPAAAARAPPPRCAKKKKTKQNKTNTSPPSRPRVPSGTGPAHPPRSHSPDPGHRGAPARPAARRGPTRVGRRRLAARRWAKRRAGTHTAAGPRGAGPLCWGWQGVGRGGMGGERGSSGRRRSGPALLRCAVSASAEDSPPTHTAVAGTRRDPRQQGRACLVPFDALSRPRPRRPGLSAAPS